MDGRVPVSVGWALWGKLPGTSRDYSVLASSADPLTEAEFASVLTHFAPGTPPTEPGLPGSLPWVTISRVGIADQVYQGIAIQDRDPDGQVDGAGRPITLTSYFCVPYSERDGAQVSYYSLYQELDQLRPRPSHSGGLIQLGVQRLDPERAAADVLKFGISVVAGTAALLLSGPVSIIGSERTRLDERLRFLDAVAALLPYGYRTGYTAATWSDSGARHPIRLAFAARPRQNAGVVRWPSAPAVVTGPGEAYLRLVLQVLEQPGDTDAPPSAERLTALIRHLADDTAPCGFDQPGHAIKSVRAFGLPVIVWGEVRDGTADTRDVREVFRQSRITELPPRGRQDLLGYLISSDDFRDEPQNTSTPEEWWDAAVGEDSFAMLPTMVKTCRPLLWTPTPSITLRKQYLMLADSHGLLDALLAELVVAPTARSELKGGLGAAAQLVADWVLAVRDPASCPRTRTALADNPLVTCRLFAQLSGSGQGARAAAAWLQPVLRDFLAPFLVVISGSPAAVGEGAIGRLADYDHEAVCALLETASSPDRLDLVLPGFASWLGRSMLEGGASDPAATRYWRDLLWALDPGAVTSRAWLDLALLISQNPPRFLLERRDQHGRLRYNECVTHGWAALRADLGQAADDVMTDTLASYLTGEPWAADASRATAVADLVQRLTGDGRRTRLREVVADRLSQAPEAAGWPFAQVWRELRRRARHEDVRDGSLVSLRRMRRGATAAQIAEACTQAFRDRLKPQDASGALADSGALDSGAMAVAVLEMLREGLLTSPAPRADVWKWLECFAQQFANGTFGAQTAKEFRDIEAQIALDDIDYRAAMLRIVAMNRLQVGQPQLSQKDAEQLDRILGSLSGSLGDPRKRPSRVPDPFRTGRQNGEGEDESR